jgi:hypothetical protein
MIALALAALAASVPVPDYTDAIAYADGRVLYAEHAFPGKPLVLRERLLGGGPARVIATIPRAGDPREDMEVSLAPNATGYLITIRTPDRDRVIHGGYDGSLRTVVDCVPESGNPAHLAAVAGTSGFAFAGTRCDPDVGLVGADGTLTPLPGIHSNTGHGLALAEPYLAVTDLETVSLFNLDTGERRALDHSAFGTATGLSVQPDGTVVSGNGVFGDGVYVWPPGAARPHRLLREKGTFGVFAAGGRVFVEREHSLGLIAGGRVEDIVAPGAGDGRKPLAFDGRHAAFHSFACSEAQQVTIVDVDAPRGVDGCPVRVVQRTLRFGKRWRASLGVVCPNGCRGDLHLTRDGEYIASGKLRLRPSRRVQRVRMRLDERISGRMKVYLGELNGLEVAGPRTVKISAQR